MAMLLREHSFRGPLARPGQGSSFSPLHLVQAEIVSVTTSIRKYSRFPSSSSSSGFGFPSASSSSGSSSSHPIAPGSHSASLTGAALSQSRRKLAAYGAEHATPKGNPTAIASVIEGGADGDGLKSALTARAKETTEAVTPSKGVPSANAQSAESLQALEPQALLNAFTVLRAQLKENGDISTFPLPLLVAPFLQTILSPRVSAPVTSAALQAINRLLVYQVVPLSHTANTPATLSSTAPPGVRLAVIDIARAISHCRFESSEPSVDELVLLRILAVMKELVCGTNEMAIGGQPSTLADLLPDESICEMMETGLSMCCQTRLSGKWGIIERRWNAPTDHVLAPCRFPQISCERRQNSISCQWCAICSRGCHRSL
jgi:brefeldin A-resistance guanine nucleotide exchange factor 1